MGKESMALLVFHKYPPSQSAHPPKAGLSRVNEVYIKKLSNLNKKRSEMKSE
jgi:hypothetical protein